MTVNILGTEYELAFIEVNKSNRPEELDSDADAFMSPHEKKIVVTPYFSAPERQRLTRHELIHAFFYESGNVDWYTNEPLVEWISVQFPKMLEVFKQIGV